MKPKLHVLSQYLCQQLCSWSRPQGYSLDQDSLRDLLAPSLPILARYDPSLWMELEAMARASDLPIQDLLIIQGYHDLLSYLGCQVAPRPSTYVGLDRTHTAQGHPLMALAWYLDPALVPYLTLLRRLPAHGPATLSVTLAGLHPIAGLSESGLAVTSNELRVRDGASGHLTAQILFSMLTAPSFEDARRRAAAVPRFGGMAVHVLASSAERCSLELSGQQTMLLSDPLATAPRAHTNHPLEEQLIPAVGLVEPTSKLRLEGVASLSVAVSGITPAQIASWFGIDVPVPMPSAATKEGDTDRMPMSMVLVIMDPMARTLHLRRSGVPGDLDVIAL